MGGAQADRGERGVCVRRGIERAHLRGAAASTRIVASLFVEEPAEVDVSVDRVKRALATALIAGKIAPVADGSDGLTARPLSPAPADRLGLAVELECAGGPVIGEQRMGGRSVDFEGEVPAAQARRTGARGRFDPAQQRSAETGTFR